MSEIVIFGGIWQVIKDVTVAFLPLVLFFLFFQLVYLKLPWTEVINILKGTLLTFWVLYCSCRVCMSCSCRLVSC